MLEYLNKLTNITQQNLSACCMINFKTIIIQIKTNTLQNDTNNRVILNNLNTLLKTNKRSFLSYF